MTLSAGPSGSKLDPYFFRGPNSQSEYPVAKKADAGGKGAGLLKLPLRWYPETLIIAPELATATGSKVSAEQLAHVAGLQVELTRLASLSPTDQLLLRSSARDESIRDRGAYLTVAINPTAEALADGMAEIWEHATKHGRTECVGFVVQPVLATKAAGHLANEHRVSRESTRWLLEIGDTSTNWRVQKSDPAADEPLSAQNPAKRDQRLRTVARRLSEQLSRVHLEWVWDGQRVWIVQADPVPPKHGDAPGDSFKPIPGPKCPQLPCGPGKAFRIRSRASFSPGPRSGRLPTSEPTN